MDMNNDTDLHVACCCCSGALPFAIKTSVHLVDGPILLVLVALKLNELSNTLHSISDQVDIVGNVMTTMLFVVGPLVQFLDHFFE